MAADDLPDVSSDSWANYQGDQLKAYATQKQKDLEQTLSVPALAGVTAPGEIPVSSDQPPVAAAPAAALPPQPVVTPPSDSSPAAASSLPDWVPDKVKSLLSQPTRRPLTFNGTYYQDPDFEQNIKDYGQHVAQVLGPQAGQFAIAQARLETGNGQQMSTPYNYGNVGNTDSNPKGGGRYGGPEDAANAWLRFITNNGRNASSQENRYYDFVQAAKNGATLPQLASLIRQAGYATDLNYVAKVVAAANRQPTPITGPPKGQTVDLPDVSQDAYANAQGDSLTEYANAKLAASQTPATGTGSPASQSFDDFIAQKFAGLKDIIGEAPGEAAQVIQHPEQEIPGVGGVENALGAGVGAVASAVPQVTSRLQGFENPEAQAQFEQDSGMQAPLTALGSTVGGALSQTPGLTPEYAAGAVQSGEHPITVGDLLALAPAGVGEAGRAGEAAEVGAGKAADLANAVAASSKVPTVASNLLTDAMTALDRLPAAEVAGSGPGAARAPVLADAVRTKFPELAAVTDAVNGGGNQLGPSIPERVHGMSQTLAQAFVDRMAPITDLGEGPSAAAVAYRGRGGSAGQLIEDKLGPVYDALDANLGKNQPLLQGFNDYVALNNYVERATALGGGIRQGPGGITSVIEARQRLTELEQVVGPEGMAKIQQADELRQSAMHDMLQEKVASGFLTQDTADALEAKYPHYNPVDVLLAVDQPAGAMSGNRLTQIGNTIKRLSVEGSPADQLSPMQSAAIALSQGRTNVMRNDAIKDALDFFKGQVKEDGTPLVPVQRALEVKAGPAVSPAQAGIPDLKASDDLTRIISPIRGDRPGTISFWNGGKRYIADMTAVPDVGKAMSAMDDNHIGMMLRVANSINAPLRAGATGLSLPFQLRQAIFGSEEAFVKLGITPPEIWKGTWDALRKTDAFKSYVEQGGAMGGLAGDTRGVLDAFRNRSIEAIGKNLENSVRNSGGILVQNPGDVLRLAAKYGLDAASLKPVRELGSAILYGPRVAAYKKALVEGMAPVQAAAKARTGIADYSQAGNVMREINMVLPFSNAAVQHVVGFGKAIQNDKTSLLRLAGLTTALSSVYAYNRQFPDRLADIPDFEKAAGTVILLPGAVKNPDGSYKTNPHVVIPSRQLGVAPYLITQGLAKADGQNPDFGRTLMASLGALNPVASATQAGAGSLLGTVGSEAFEQAANYDPFRARQIVSESLANKEPGMQATPQTEPANTGIAALFNRSPLRNLPLIGGEKSPVRIQHALQSTTGSLAPTVEQSVDAARGQSPTNLPPLVGSIAGGIYKDYGGQSAQNEFNARDSKMDQLLQQHRDLMESMTANGATLGPPPKAIGGIQLKPSETADYRGYELEFLSKMFEMHPELNGRLAAIPTDNPRLVTAREDILKSFQQSAASYAEGQMVKQLGAGEIRARVTAATTPDQRSLYPQKDYTPVGAQ